MNDQNDTVSLNTIIYSMNDQNDTVSLNTIIYSRKFIDLLYHN